MEDFSVNEMLDKQRRRETWYYWYL